MNATRHKYLPLAVFLMCNVFAFVSCEYDTIADAPYPESLIYLPIAVDGSTSPGGIYTIEEGASTAWISPTPGQPMRYDVKKDENLFIIPLGVYRSGFEGKLASDVDITLSFDTDTVNNLIKAGTLADTTKVLPVERLQLPHSVNIEAGENNALFNLTTDLDFLRADAPQIYAIGIHIASNNGTVNPDLTTGIVVINTQITIPVADFVAQLDGSTTDTYNFTNNSLYWDFFDDTPAFTWDFGDGSTSFETNPQHQYAAPGTYNVTLHVRGITGEETSTTEQVVVS